MQIAGFAQKRARQRVPTQIGRKTDVQRLVNVTEEMREELECLVLLCASLRGDTLGVVQNGSVQTHVVRAVG